MNRPRPGHMALPKRKTTANALPLPKCHRYRSARYPPPSSSSPPPLQPPRNRIFWRLFRGGPDDNCSSNEVHPVYPSPNSTVSFRPSWTKFCEYFPTDS
ncbi:hypothetical protein V9T40_011852 [Parthenolecanium corni]|uniref:Uncharacterized protein n=1 Tax=Parthenolecanium corni TaxID=536013 RepID=A0AAN9XYJ2_9HEMI